MSRDNATGAFRYDQGQVHQSEADAGGVSLVAYIHAIFDLLLQAGCREVLMIGCGGGTLATMLHGAGIEVTIADVDSWSFRLARQYFRLPAGVVCHAVDGAELLAESAQLYDAIVLDAYVGNHLPPQFGTAGCLRIVRDRLRSPAGLFIANVHVLDDGDRAAAHYGEQVAAVWPDSRLLDAPGKKNRNALVLAGVVAALNSPRLRIAPAIGGAEISADLAGLRFAGD
ncbi:MAG: spermidine synthase [Dongiaceae bacterium]